MVLDNEMLAEAPGRGCSENSCKGTELAALCLYPLFNSDTDSTLDMKEWFCHSDATEWKTPAQKNDGVEY